jgi:hypothetical protein
MGENMFYYCEKYIVAAKNSNSIYMCCLDF